MERKVSWSLYAAAFIISSAIFIAGIYVGMLIDTGDVQTISSDVDELSQRISTMQLLVLTDSNSSAFCPLYASELASIDEEREKLGYELSFLEEQRKIDAPELKKEYFILEAQSYFLSKRLKDLCEDESILLLYFYSNQNCSDCTQQGVDILSARDRVSKNVRIYSFDGELGSPVAEAFMQQFNITEYPSVVIDNKVYGGYVTEDELVVEFSE
jgi:hypothetical protein